MSDLGSFEPKTEQGVRRKPADDKPSLEEALKHAILTNTVPFKPIGNKAYPDEIRERFRPFLERLLVNHWKGQNIITLGTQAFAWFTPYGEEAEFGTAGGSEARFEKVFRCKLPGSSHDARGESKTVMVYPLPHPSPLNRRWYSRFPAMLAARLERGARPANLIFSARQTADVDDGDFRRGRFRRRASSRVTEVY